MLHVVTRVNRALYEHVIASPFGRPHTRVRSGFRGSAAYLESIYLVHFLPSGDLECSFLMQPLDGGADGSSPEAGQPASETWELTRCFDEHCAEAMKSGRQAAVRTASLEVARARGARRVVGWAEADTGASLYPPDLDGLRGSAAPIRAWYGPAASPVALELDPLQMPEGVTPHDVEILFRAMISRPSAAAAMQELVHAVAKLQDTLPESVLLDHVAALSADVLRARRPHS